MFKINNFIIISFILALVSCSGSDEDNSIIVEASISSSNDSPNYNEVYTISWESNASQCFAISSTGSWLGELETSGSQDFVAKREGLANYGVQCRTSINFVNASTDVVVDKDFIDYFDYIDADIYDLGSLSFDSQNQVSILDTTISDFNGDFKLDIVVLLEDSGTSDLGDSEYYFLTFYGRDLSSITQEDPYTIVDINQGSCVADEFVRGDFNDDGLLDIMSISSSSSESLNKRGICFFLASQEGLTLQEDDFIINETNLDLSHVVVGSHVAYDVNANFKPDILLFGNGGTTDLPFYVIPSENGPSILLPPPLDSLNPYTRTNGCAEGLTFICDWISRGFKFKNSVITPADDDGVLDIIHSVNTLSGSSYILDGTRLSDENSVYFDWSSSEDNYLLSSISTGDGIALKMFPGDGNIDGGTDLFILEKSLSSAKYKLSIYEKVITEDDSPNELSNVNNGDFPDEYTFENGLKFSKDFLIFDVDASGYSDVFIPYTELPYNQNNLQSDKHFLAFEKSYVVNEDGSNDQEWIIGDFSNLIGLDSNSVNNSWIDFDGDNDVDTILMIPELSNDNQIVTYNFRIYLNNSLF